jgi:hypothetical protein
MEQEMREKEISFNLALFFCVFPLRNFFLEVIHAYAIMFLIRSR